MEPGRGEESPAAVTGTVVARFGDHRITTRDVDSHVVGLPPADRPAPGTDLDAWYREQIRQLAITEALRDEAKAGQIGEDPAFQDARREAEKLLGLQLCLASLRPDLKTVTEDDLRAAFEKHAESLEMPERRSVYHLFLRRTSAGSADATRAAITELRDRALRGESFLRLAGEHSESEGRHRQGLLGWIVPGVLPEGFERVIFALDEGVPSEPVETRDGFHLFYVDQTIPGRTVTFVEVRSRLTEVLVAERQVAALAELEASVPTPEGWTTLDRQGFEGVVAAGDAEAVVLSTGDLELTLGTLRRRLGQAVRRGAPPAPQRTVSEDAAWEFLERLRRRELIHRHCRETGQIPQAELATRMESWTEANLAQIQRRRRLLEIASRDEERLRLFYESNIGSFSSPPQWHVRLLKLAVGPEAPRTMARLERAAARQDEGLDALARELGGEVEDLGFLDRPGLTRVAVKLPAAVAPLKAGQLAAPYRIGEWIEMAEVVERRAPQPLPFEEVRERVAAAYVDQYTHEVYEELASEILGPGDAKLEISEEGLAALREAGLPRPEISAEQIESLLDEL